MSTFLDIKIKLNNAIEAHSIDIAKEIVRSHKNLLDEDFFGLTVFHISVEEDFTEFISFLLEQGVDVNFLDKDGLTAIFFAGGKGQVETVSFLLANGADPNGTVKPVDGLYLDATPIVWATREGQLEVVKEYVKHGASLNISHNGDSLLDIARESGNEEVIEYLSNIVSYG